MQERSFLQSVLALPASHRLAATGIALATAASFIVGSHFMPVEYASSASLSFQGDAPTVATAESILATGQFAALAKHLLPERTRTSSAVRLHSRITLTEPVLGNLLVTIRENDPRASIAAANAIAALLAAWVPLDSPPAELPSLAGDDTAPPPSIFDSAAPDLHASDSPASSDRPIPSDSPAPPQPANAALPKSPAHPAAIPGLTPSPIQSPAQPAADANADLQQLKLQLAARQAELERQFDSVNRKLVSLDAQKLKLQQNPAAARPSLAAVTKQATQLNLRRDQLLRLLDANDSANDALRARERAAARQAATPTPSQVAAPATPQPVAHDDNRAPLPPAQPAPTPQPPSAVVPPTSTFRDIALQDTAPSGTTPKPSFTVLVWAREAHPVNLVFKRLLLWTAPAIGILCGLLYLILAVRRYRPVRGAAALKQALPARVIFLGSIPGRSS